MFNKISVFFVVLAIGSMANAGHTGIKTAQFDGPLPAPPIPPASVSSSMPLDTPFPPPPIAAPGAVTQVIEIEPIG